MAEDKNEMMSQSENTDGKLNNLSNFSNTEEVILKALPKDMPEEDRKKVKEVIEISLQSRMSNVALNRNPLSEKITDKNISEIIQIKDRDGERQLKNAKSKRTHSIIILSILLFFVLVIIFKFSDKPDMLLSILPFIAAFVGGGGIGYGIGFKKRK